MRVLHVSHFYPPELSGGVQRVVQGLAVDQRRRGWSLQLVIGSPHVADEPTAEAFEHHGTPVVRLRRSRAETFSGDLGSERIGDAVGQLAREFAPDVCHVHHWHGLTTDLVQRLSAVAPVVATLHDSYITCPRFFRAKEPPQVCRADLTTADCARCLQPDLGLPENELAALLETRHSTFAAELTAARAVTAPSQFLKQLVQDVPWVPDVPIQVVPLGVLDPPQPLPIRPPQERFRLGHWTGVDPRKGLDLLVNAIAASPHAARIELVVFGTALAEDYLPSLQHRAGAATVRHGGVFHDTAELRSLVESLDAAVLPSLLPESYGLAVDEALHLGLPLIISDRGAPAERVGTRALVVPVTSEAPLQEAIDRLIDNPALRDQLRAGTHGAQPFALTADRFAALYRDIV